MVEYIYIFVHAGNVKNRHIFWELCILNVLCLILVSQGVAKKIAIAVAKTIF